MILDGVLPLDYNYTDIPLLSGTFLNATHIQDSNITTQILILIFSLLSSYIAFNTLQSLLTLQRTNAENSKQIFPEKELCGHSPNFHIHESVSDLNILMIDLPILLQGNMWTDPGNI
jgi:hypothetical protein